MAAAAAVGVLALNGLLAPADPTGSIPCRPRSRRPSDRSTRRSALSFGVMLVVRQRRLRA
ncbi:hypothetical protein NKG94_12005 [Micromonospora sp. M12]